MCLKNELSVPVVKIGEVAVVCPKVFIEMGLNVMKNETSAKAARLSLPKRERCC
jgi:hypothetical protein